MLNVCLFFYAVLSAQLTESRGQYPYVHYTPKDGLVNSRVRKAYQDSKGRMYFITYGGLSIYDGARFRNYTTQNGLLADLVNDVLEVGEDSLLVAVNTCGLNVLVHGRMKQLEAARNSCPIVNQFLKSNDGTIYATTDDGLYKLNSKGLQKLPAVLPKEKIPAVYLGVITEYKDFLIFTTNDLRHYKGLFVYNKKTNVITDALPDLYVYSLKKDHSSIIWIGTNTTISILDSIALSNGKLELLKPVLTGITRESFQTGQLNFNRQNELLVASGSKGITRYRKDGSLLHIASPEFSTTVIQNFFIDREGVIWICHDGNGVYKLSNTQLQSAASYLNESMSGIKTIRSDSPDTCWIMTNDNRLILHTPAGNKSFVIKSPVSVSSLFYNNHYLYAASAKQLFIAPIPEGNEKIIRFRQILSISDTNSFGGRFVSDPYGNTILFEHNNICVFQNDKLLFTYPINSYDLIEGMHIDRNNQLWVVSRGSCLQILSIHPENPSHYLQHKQHFLKEFEKASPRWITVDNNELLWVGTRFDGLMAFEYKNNQLKKLYHFQTHNGLTDNFITSLACDADNNIIVGTQTGLDRLIKTKDGYRPENITKSNNIFAYINYVWADVNNNAFAWSNTGNVFQVEPVRYTKDQAEPQLLIEEIKVNGKPVPQIVLPLRLKYFQRNISFNVAAPSFIDEKQIKYSYLLTGGGNTEWSDTTADAGINLLNLSPGSYSLRVKAFFPSTSYATKEVRFSFVIFPPWWRTWWFRLIAGLLITGLVITAVRTYYRRKLEKQRNILEKKQAIEKERTRIATDMHDDLGAGLSTIRFLSEKVKRNTFSEVTKNDAEKIVTNSNDLVQKMNEIIWAMNEKNDTLEDLLFYTRAYAAEYCEENNLSCETRLPEKIPPVVVNGELRRNVFLTVKESLHNIVKHAGAEKVTLDFIVDTSLVITVKDNGQGFSVNTTDSGNGLRNMKKRIESINGIFEIVSNNGVLIKLIIPLQV